MLIQHIVQTVDVNATHCPDSWCWCNTVKTVMLIQHIVQTVADNTTHCSNCGCWYITVVKLVQTVDVVTWYITLSRLWMLICHIAHVNTLQYWSLSTLWMLVHHSIKLFKACPHCGCWYITVLNCLKLVHTVDADTSQWYSLSRLNLHHSSNACPDWMLIHHSNEAYPDSGCTQTMGFTTTRTFFLVLWVCSFMWNFPMFKLFLASLVDVGCILRVCLLLLNAAKT